MREAARTASRSEWTGVQAMPFIRQQEVKQHRSRKTAKVAAQSAAPTKHARSAWTDRQAAVERVAFLWKSGYQLKLAAACVAQDTRFLTGDLSSMALRHLQEDAVQFVNRQRAETAAYRLACEEA
jgi:hypothetical protein